MATEQGQDIDAAQTQSAEAAPEVDAAQTAETKVNINQLLDDSDAAIDYLYNKGKMEASDAEEAIKREEAPAGQETQSELEVAKTPEPEIPAEKQDDEWKMPQRIPTDQFDEATQRAMRVMRAHNGTAKPGEPGYRPLSDFIEQPQIVSRTESAVEKQATQSEVALNEVVKVKASIAALRAKRTDAMASGETDEVTQLDAKLDDERQNLLDAQLEARFAERDAVAEQAQRANQHQQSVTQAREVAIQEALNRFPTLADPNSVLSARVALKIQEMQNPDHKNHSALRAVDAPIDIALKAVTELAAEQEAKGIPFEQALAAYMAKPKATTAPAAKTEPRKILPASGARGTATPPPAKSGEDLIEEAERDPEKALEAIYGNRKLTFI